MSPPVSIVGRTFGFTTRAPVTCSTRRSTAFRAAVPKWGSPSAIRAYGAPSAPSDMSWSGSASGGGRVDGNVNTWASALYFGAATVYIVWMIVSMHRETVRTNRLIEVIQSQTEFSRTLFDFRSELSMELSEGRLDMASQARVWRHFDRLQKQMDAHFRDVRKLAGLQSARDRS